MTRSLGTTGPSHHSCSWFLIVSRHSMWKTWTQQIFISWKKLCHLRKKVILSLRKSHVIFVYQTKLNLLHPPLKLWRQLYFRVKSIIFYILSKYHPSFYPNAEMFAELPDSRKERLFPMIRKQSMRSIIDFRPKTLFPLKFSSFFEWLKCVHFLHHGVSCSLARYTGVAFAPSIWKWKSRLFVPLLLLTTKWGPWASADKMFYAHIYRGPLDQMTDVKMITVTEDKSLKEDKEEQLRFLRFRNCDKWRLENAKQKTVKRNKNLHKFTFDRGNFNKSWN